MKNYSLLFCLLLFMSAEGTPLSGNYTINSAAVTGATNFQSFNALADSLNLNGVSGNVMVTVTPGSGPYNEKVVFDNVPGTSATSTVTIDGSNETITDLTDSTNRCIVRLKNVQYFTVTNLRVDRQSAALSGFYGIQILESGRNITISNCVITMSGTASTLVGGIIASGSTTSILQEGDFHDILISHDTCTGGGYGASVYGLSTLATGIVISDNVFYDWNSNGVYLRETDSTVVCRNYFDKRDQYVNSTNAIQVAQAANINTQIYDNHIKISQLNNGTQTIRGIYLFNGTGHRVYNNVISEINLTSGDFTAIEVRTSGSAPDIYFNTISIDNPNQTSGELIGFKESLNNTGSKLLNNMISITQPTTGIKAGIAISSSSVVNTTITSNHNNIWVPGGSFALKGLLLNPPTYYTTLSTWQFASNQDSVSFELDPFFNTANNPVPTNALLDNQGQAVGYVTTDILGNGRNSTPDIGAYEFIALGLNKNLNFQSLNVFPNPAVNFISIDTQERNFALFILDACGKYVISKSFISYDGEPIDVSFLPSGFYSAILENGVSRFTTTLVK